MNVNPAHVAARLCAVPADAAFRHLTAAAAMARWTLGLWECREVERNLLVGTSLFDGSRGWVRLEVDAARLAVDYWVGAERDVLQPRIHARVTRGDALGHSPQQCVVTLLAWRPALMTDERWHRLAATHETEVELIRAQLETAR